MVSTEKHHKVNKERKKHICSKHLKSEARRKRNYSTWHRNSPDNKLKAASKRELKDEKLEEDQSIENKNYNIRGKL